MNATSKNITISPSKKMGKSTRKLAQAISKKYKLLSQVKIRVVHLSI